MNLHSTLITSLFTVSILLSGCGTQSSSDPTDTDSHHADNGDLQEETASTSVLPHFLEKKDKAIKTIYAEAGQHKDLLENMPCYCGCGESAGHLNNYDCFVFESKKNGQVVWDDHGTRCGVCLQIAADSIAMDNEGKTVKEIRLAIDKKYADGYSKPTPTPMPEK